MGKHKKASKRKTGKKQKYKAKSLFDNVVRKLKEENAEVADKTYAIDPHPQGCERTSVTFRLNGKDRTYYVESVQPEEVGVKFDREALIYRFSNEDGDAVRHIALENDFAKNPLSFKVCTREYHEWESIWSSGYYYRYDRCCWYSIKNHSVPQNRIRFNDSIDRIFIGIAVYYAFYAKSGVSIDTWLEYWKFQLPSWRYRPRLTNPKVCKELPEEGLVMRKLPGEGLTQLVYSTSWDRGHMDREPYKRSYNIKGIDPVELEFKCDFAVRAGHTFAFKKVPKSRFGTGYEFEMYDLYKGEHVLTYDARNRCLVDDYDYNRFLGSEEIIQTGLAIYTIFIRPSLSINKPGDGAPSCKEWILEWEKITGAPAGEEIEDLTVIWSHIWY